MRLSRSAAERSAASTATPWRPVSWGGWWRTGARSRAAHPAVNLCDAVPPEPCEAVEELAACARALQDTSTAATRAAREAAPRAAVLANAVLEATGKLSAVHIVGQIRLAAVDLLRATGLDAMPLRSHRGAGLDSGDP